MRLILLNLCLLFTSLGLQAQKAPESVESMSKRAPLSRCARLRANVSAITGSVSELTGNQMPSTNKKSEKSETPVSRVIVVYPLATADDFVEDSLNPSFFIRAKKLNPVAIVRSRLSRGGNGSFQIPIKPGKYSVFVIENGKLYANSYNGTMHINPVTVLKGKESDIELLLDYKASY
jgi:hypothetical protein